MKTPREILLQKHQSAKSALDEIRREVVRTEATAKTELESFHLLRTLWEQLIIPSRRVWAGFACAWIAVFILHGATGADDSTQFVSAPSTKVTQETRVALQAQQRLVAELLNERQTSHASAPPAAHRPRSERRVAIRFA